MQRRRWAPLGALLAVACAPGPAGVQAEALPAAPSPSRTDPPKSPPAPEPQAPGSPHRIATGRSTTCTVAGQGGRVRCWGANAALGIPPEQQGPETVPGLESGAVAVASGNRFACALLDDGSVKCAGACIFGSRDGACRGESDGPAVVDVEGFPAPVRSLTAGERHACALTIDGEVLCWGDNSLGQLGGGDLEPKQGVVSVAGFESGARGVAAGGDETCAVNGEGRVSCWGATLHFRMSAGGQFEPQGAPQPMPKLGSGNESVAVGPLAGCAVSGGGEARCWGYAPLLGNGVPWGTGSSTDDPAILPNLGVPVRRVTIGSQHACALGDDGHVFCWGSNALGSLGDGTTQDRVRPTWVRGCEEIESLSATNGHHTCAARADGVVLCWGSNSEGEAGRAEGDIQRSPYSVPGI